MITWYRQLDSWHFYKQVRIIETSRPKASRVSAAGSCPTHHGTCIQMASFWGSQPASCGQKELCRPGGPGIKGSLEMEAGAEYVGALETESDTLPSTRQNLTLPPGARTHREGMHTSPAAEASGKDLDTLFVPD